VKFTADDVVMTFDALLDPDVGAWSEGDYVGILDDSVHPGGCEKLDDYTVRFHLTAPYVELKDLLANEWGAFILPYHIFDGAGVARGDWYRHWSNDVVDGVPPPGTGPYRWVERNIEQNFWRLEKVPNYPTGLNPFGYGEQVFDEIIGYKIDDPTAGWTALMNHEIHFGYGSWDATPAQLIAANATGEFHVFKSPIPAVRHLCLNLKHPILSNRYVRQAIAHAINYPKIRDDILPLAGINGFLQATPVWRSLEQFYPTPAEEALYNIGPYPYDIAVAQQYMDKWKYSLTANANGTLGDPNVALGPVGDNDFSGIVELDDFVVWAENVGTAPEAWPWWPGQDIDPDADNTDFVELADFYDWREKVGSYYPFYGAR
jgi:ABC-type transport system substrate-binding protein